MKTQVIRIAENPHLQTAFLFQTKKIVKARADAGGMDKNARKVIPHHFFMAIKTTKNALIM
jgi:hypothetical protein